MNIIIKWVYFDVGGVVIKDFSESNIWEEMLNEIGIAEEKRGEFHQYYDKLEDKVNLGLDLDRELAEFKKFGFNYKAGYSMVADFVSRFEQNRSLWPVIEKIKKTARIGLLTNIYPNMLDKIMEAELLPPIMWDVIIDSSKVGVKKPSKEIFEMAFKQAQEFHPRGVFGGRPVHPGGEILAAEEILFVDNKEENLEAPKKMGWQTFWYDSADYEKSSQLLDKYLGENL